MGWAKQVLAALALIAAGFLPASAQQAQRHALVIGNAAYRTPGWELVNPVNDATLIASRLRPLGFDVTLLTNATRPQMDAARGAFVARLRAGGADAVGVFYYAGHAVEHDGANLLVPIEVNARSMDELRDQAPPMQFLLRDVARVGNAVNIVVLDACRNLPLASGTRAGPAGGLAELQDVPDNVLIAYATRPGLTAPDYPGEANSIFTRTLADALQSNASDTAVNLFSVVQAKVFAATGREQRPEFRSGLLRAPDWRFATSASAARPVIDPELERLRRENEVLRRPGVGTPSGPLVSSRPVSNAGSATSRQDVGAAGSTFRDCDVCPEMVHIPGGTFLMGSSSGETEREANEGPQRHVTIQPFAAGKYEITFDEWDACARGGGCGGYAPQDRGWGRERQPVINVTWKNAQAYAVWLNGRVSAARYRLLTEAEWEYAARAGTTGPYFTGSTISAAHANINLALRRTARVGSYEPNAFGLYDVGGNVQEWVQDCYVANYNGAPSEGSSAVETTNCDRILRDGSWGEGPLGSRSARRSHNAPSSRSSYVGFRLAKTL